jgi:glycosyltransferase involved in cell wall biosynthesis
MLDMVIGIDASALLKPQPTGVEKYARFLLEAMMKEPLQAGESVVLYGRGPAPAWLRLPQGWEWKDLPFSLAKGWTHFRLSRELTEHSPDVFFSPAHEVPLATGKAKVVTTVHDIAFAKNPKLYSVFQNIRQRFAVKYALRAASTILAVSESTKRDLVTVLHASPEKIRVTPLGVVPHTLPQKDFGFGTYFLYVGRIEEKKNVGTLIRAFIELKAKEPGEIKLILAGSLGFGGEAIKKEAEQSAAAHNIRFLGYLPDDDIVGLYRGALAFVFPSLDEGFGLPILEAMTSGVPTLVSDIPVFHEVAGSASEFADPKNASAFADKMGELLRSPELRQALRLRGLAQAEKYSWDKTAALTWAALRSA